MNGSGEGASLVMLLTRLAWVSGALGAVSLCELGELLVENIELLLVEVAGPTVYGTVLELGRVGELLLLLREAYIFKEEVHEHAVVVEHSELEGQLLVLVNTAFLEQLCYYQQHACVVQLHPLQALECGGFHLWPRSLIN